MIRFHNPFEPSQIKLLIFDLDGTLIDSRLDLVHSVNATLRHMGRPQLPDDLIASYVGDGAPMLIRRALGPDADNEEIVRDGLEFFLAYYREHKLDHTRVYDGIAEALAAIRQSSNGVPRQMAVLTNKPVNASRAIVEALGLGEFFPIVYGGNSFATKKPDPEGAQVVLQESGVGPNQALIVGDSAIDVATGRNAGIWSCGVTYGFAPHTLRDNPPDVVVDSPHELAGLFSSPSNGAASAAP
ncbi:MAG TPA: HAD-IA family hydrolase [Terriglobales bacterium]|jgi:phosphoglycolate phosphatase